MKSAGDRDAFLLKIDHFFEVRIIFSAGLNRNRLSVPCGQLLLGFSEAAKRAACDARDQKK
jgi:hypothetical protein